MIQWFNPLLSRTGSRERLTRLELDLLAFVTNSLALVRLGLADAPQLGGELPDRLLVGAGHVNLWAFQCHRHVAGNRNCDGIRIANRQDNVLALLLGLVTNALDLQRFLVAVG